METMVNMSVVLLVVLKYCDYQQYNRFLCEKSILYKSFKELQLLF